MMPIVSEQVELVQVLLYLSDRQERVMQHLNNKTYSEAISAFFLPHKNHKAVNITKNLIDNNNFIHIEPLHAILSLELILKEYGQKHVSTPLAKYYLLEHGETIIAEKAVKALAKTFGQ